jgi:hypothetical protein
MTDHEAAVLDAIRSLADDVVTPAMRGLTMEYRVTFELKDDGSACFRRPSLRPVEEGGIHWSHDA